MATRMLLQHVEETAEMPRKKSAKREASIPAGVEENGGNPDPLEAGQAGDVQGLPDEPSASSQSVRELVEEGQAFEAGIVAGVENAPPADEEEVTVSEVRADDVPLEYEQDKDEPKE
jgi:hypothetical protein